MMGMRRSAYLEAFERIMSAGQRFKVGDLYARTSDPRLARLAAGLSSAPERARQGTISVSDPAAGPGDLLVAVADVIGPDHQAIYQAAEADSYLARLADRGSILGMDRFGINFAITPAQRVATIAEMVKRGYADRLGLSHDCTCWSDYFPTVADYEAAGVTEAVFAVMVNAAVLDVMA